MYQNYQPLKPLQDKVELYIKHHFTNSFQIFAYAFMKKYNQKSSFNTCTIHSMGTIDEHRFGFIRRYDNMLTSDPVYEQVIYDRKKQSIEAHMLDDKYPELMAEKCVYTASENGETIYETFLYKNPGWKTYLRKKCHSWGVDTMNELLEKEQKFISEKKDQLKELKIGILDKSEKMKDSLSGLKDKIKSKNN